MTVPGFEIAEDAVGFEREARLVAWIEQSIPPAPIAKRHRLDMYGDGLFSRGTGRLVSKQIPPILAVLAVDLFGGIVGVNYDTISISEYLPGQGVAAHTDRAEAGPVIHTLSLLAEARLVFRRAEPSFSYTALHAPRRALFTIAGECRYAPWTHQLEPVTERRISIAFRGVRGP